MSDQHSSKQSAVPRDSLAISILYQEVGRNAVLAPELGKEEEGLEEGVRILSQLTCSLRPEGTRL